MRTTQFIGLNSDAHEFLEKSKAKRIATYCMTSGMFDEEIMGDIWEVETHYDYYGIDSITKRTYVEIVQAEPWSSGPMIFTCLLDLCNQEKSYLWSDAQMYE